MSTISLQPLSEVADEAQALPATEMDWARVRHGEVIETGHIEIPGTYYDAALSAVIEHLTLARNKVKREVPGPWAEGYTNMLVQDGSVRREDARRVEAVLETAFRKAIDAAFTESRDRLNRRLTLSLRSLIPLIRRSIRKS